MTGPGRRGLALAVALLSGSTTANEILLVRLFGVEHFHHFATMAIGVALLGLGASGTFGALFPVRDVDGAERRLRAAAAVTAVALVASPWLAHQLNVEPTQLPFDRGQWLRLAVLVAVLAIPFLAGGVATLTAFLLAPERTGRLYGASFGGGALGVVLALLVLFILPPARSLVMPPLLAALAALVLGRSWVALGAGAAAAVLFLGPSWDARLSPYKSLPQLAALPEARRVAERFGPLGWVLAIESPSFHLAPGLSLSFHGPLPKQIALLVDGDLAGAATDLTDPAAARVAEALPVSLAHALAPRRRVLLLGVGDGLALGAALESDARWILTLEPNPDLLGLARQLAPLRFWQAERVEDRTGNARGLLARERSAFDLVALGPSVGLGASVGGVRALQEDFLHTVDGYESFLRHLEPEGVLSVTTWISTPPRESVRALLTAAAALRRLGHPPALRLVVVRNWGTVTVLARSVAFSAGELARLRAWARERSLDVDWPPDEGSTDVPFNVLDDASLGMAAAAASRSEQDVVRFAGGYPFDVAPVDDARPYPHHFLRLASLPALVRGAGSSWLPFAEWGPIALLATLVQTVGVAALLLLVPVLLWGRRGEWTAPRWVVLGYFGALGGAYMAAEIAAIQQLGLLLGHPVHAVAAVLVIFLAGSGAGSLWSDRVSPDRGVRVCALLALLLALAALTLLPLVHLLLPAVTPVRTVAVLGSLLPLAFLMGMPFPLGLRGLVRDPGPVAWAWASNGFASVVAVPLSALLSLELGSRLLFLAAGVAYALAAVAAGVGARSRGTRAA